MLPGMEGFHIVVCLFVGFLGVDGGGGGGGGGCPMFCGLLHKAVMVLWHSMNLVCCMMGGPLDSM